MVDIDDLLAVIGAWGDCGGTPEAFPGSLNDCFTVYCDGLSGDAWEECLEMLRGTLRSPAGGV